MKDSDGNAVPKASNHEDLPFRVQVWDLPTRLFHWLLVVLVTISFVTGKIGGTAMLYHEWSGVAIVALVVFRVLWGFVGGAQSRFTAFVSGPRAVADYLRSLVRTNSKRYLGHNPLGGWSIIAMLVALSIQVGTGLFANDDILTEGPLFQWVSKATSDWLTRIHHINQAVLVSLVSIHVGAVFFYLLVKRENLVTPMITGCKNWYEAVDPAGGGLAKAFLLAAVLALVTYMVIY